MKKTYTLPTAKLEIFCKDDIMNASPLQYEESGPGNSNSYGNL